MKMKASEMSGTTFLIPLLFFFSNVGDFFDKIYLLKKISSDLPLSGESALNDFGRYKLIWLILIQTSMNINFFFGKLKNFSTSFALETVKDTRGVEILLYYEATNLFLVRDNLVRNVIHGR